MFKVGDWVRTKDYSGNIEVKRYANTQAFVDGYYKTINLWKPEEGEWCWCNRLGFGLYANNHFATLESRLHNKGLEVLDTDIFEPFIGELPSFIKEK